MSLLIKRNNFFVYFRPIAGGIGKFTLVTEDLPKRYLNILPFTLAFSSCTALNVPLTSKIRNRIFYSIIIFNMCMTLAIWGKSFIFMAACTDISRTDMITLPGIDKIIGVGARPIIVKRRLPIFFVASKLVCFFKILVTFCKGRFIINRITPGKIFDLCA